jgi:prolyl-tRNA editing enzyme YbaK/EbsC (Cys-tRNA(Pro) deacylase)
MNDLHPAVAAALAASGIPHRVVQHADLGVPVDGPRDAAAACGLEVGQITKTLLLGARDGRTFVVVTPVLDRLPLRTLAAALKAGRLSLACWRGARSWSAAARPASRSGSPPSTWSRSARPM